MQKTVKQIAIEMGVSECAVYNLRKRIEKFGYGTRVQRDYLKATGKELVVIDRRK